MRGAKREQKEGKEEARKGGEESGGGKAREREEGEWDERRQEK